MKTLSVLICAMVLVAIAFAQAPPQPHFSPAEAKSHVGEMATVCGKVVDTKTSRYGIAGHGKPVTFDLDQPEPTPVFYFVTFGAQPEGPSEAITAYQSKHVCVTGKITTSSTGPYIMAADRSQIKPEPADK